MPLNAPRLSAAIRAGLLANPATLAQDNASLTATCDAIALAVLSEITANAVVNPLPGLVAPPAGGPVTGFGSVQ